MRTTYSMARLAECMLWRLGWPSFRGDIQHSLQDFAKSLIFTFGAIKSQTLQRQKSVCTNEIKHSLGTGIWGLANFFIAFLRCSNVNAQVHCSCMLTDSKNTDFKRFRANYAVSVQSVANDLFVRISVEFRQFLGVFPQAVSFVQKHYLHTKLPNSWNRLNFEIDVLHNGSCNIRFVFAKTRVSTARKSMHHMLYVGTTQPRSIQDCIKTYWAPLVINVSVSYTYTRSKNPFTNI